MVAAAEGSGSYFLVADEIIFYYEEFCFCKFFLRFNPHYSVHLSYSLENKTVLFRHFLVAI